LRFLLLQTVVLTFASKLPVIKVDRPHGGAMPSRDQAISRTGRRLALPNYRGVNANDISFTAARTISGLNRPEVGRHAQPVACLCQRRLR
jgi:3-deoxy-D-arabino-heptulosonate 7-phosphate (DAHP) synthase class II